MNAKRVLALLLAALITAAAFAGCAAKSYSSSHSEQVEIAPDDSIYDSSTAVSPTITERKLIRRISLDAQTTDMDAMLTGIDAKVGELGGYVENRNVYTGSNYSGKAQNRYANLTVRIPAEKLDTFVSHVGDVSNVTSTNETAEDVTLNYVATESRMKALQAEEARLLTLIDKAANLSELLQLEKRLTEVRTELEQVTSQLKLYDNLVDYGTVTLTINEVQEYTPTEEPGFWNRITAGFADSMQNLGMILKELVIFFVCAIPYLVPVLAVGGIVLLIVKLTKRKKKPHEENKE